MFSDTSSFIMNDFDNGDGKELKIEVEFDYEKYERETRWNPGNVEGVVINGVYLINDHNDNASEICLLPCGCSEIISLINEEIDELGVY